MFHSFEEKLPNGLMRTEPHILKRGVWMKAVSCRRSPGVIQVCSINLSMWELKAHICCWIRVREKSTS